MAKLPGNVVVCFLPTTINMLRAIIEIRHGITWSWQGLNESFAYFGWLFIFQHTRQITRKSYGQVPSAILKLKPSDGGEIMKLMIIFQSVRSLLSFCDNSMFRI